jgi:hypothetical protein
MLVIPILGGLIMALFGVLFYLDVMEGRAYMKEDLAKMLKYNKLIAGILVLISILGLILFMYMVINPMTLWLK